ncbi:MAG: hypothetical protein K2X47_05225 [Bdellovibrionales bacterium]|nr:hypothetical protein [Bdellovibrionales bacterium]
MQSSSNANHRSQFFSLTLFASVTLLFLVGPIDGVVAANLTCSLIASGRLRIHDLTEQHRQNSPNTGLRYNTPLADIPVPIGLSAATFRELFERFRGLGYSDGVIQKIIGYRLRTHASGRRSLENFQKKYFSPNYEEDAMGSAIVLYRGINSLKYSPTYRAGTFLRSGFKWATSVLEEALGFADDPLNEGSSVGGHVLELEVPYFALNYWSWNSPGRAKIQLSEIPDDRVFTSRVGRVYPSRVEWFTYDQAVRNGMIDRLSLPPGRRRPRSGT